MLYHVIRRPPHNNPTNNSNQPPRSNQRSGSVPTSKLMPRYHYSKIVPNSAKTNSDSVLTQNNLGGNSSKLSMTTTSNNNNPYGSFTSTFIPLVTNNRTMTPNKREFIQIPIQREDGTSVTTNNNNSRSVPITYMKETATLPPTGNNENTNLKSNLNSFLRPSSKYFQRHFSNTNEEPTMTRSNIPRLPSVARRLSLTIPVMTTTVINTDDETTKPVIPSSPIRQIPIRLPQATTSASIPTNSSRISSAILRSSPFTNSLQRQKTDIGNAASSSSSPLLPTANISPLSSSDFAVTSSSPVRRAEVMAREAIQGITRLQQQRNGSINENNNNRSPSLSRRVVINLKNNQSVSLDSRLSSAMKPPQIPPSSFSRLTQRNNLYHIPVLHEIQLPPHSSTTASAETSSPNNGNYKNEFRMEIPVTVTTSGDQENQIDQHNGKEDNIFIRERISSASLNSNQTLKSILKRSSSRETLSRKNVSFMNA